MNDKIFVIADCKISEFDKSLKKIVDIYIKQIFGELSQGNFSNNTEKTTVKVGNISCKLLLTTSNKNLLNFVELKKVTGMINKILQSKKIDIACVLPDFETIKKSITVNYIFYSFKENESKFKTIDCKSKIVSSGKTQEKKQETGNTETETQETETQKQETEEFEKMFKKLDKFKFDIIVKYCEKKGYTVKKTVKVNKKENSQETQKQEKKQDNK